MNAKPTVHNLQETIYITDSFA